MKKILKCAVIFVLTLTTILSLNCMTQIKYNEVISIKEIADQIEDGRPFNGYLYGEYLEKLLNIFSIDMSDVIKNEKGYINNNQMYISTKGEKVISVKKCMLENQNMTILYRFHDEKLHSVEYAVNWERLNEKEQLNIYNDIKKEMLTILGKPFSSNIYNGALLNEDTHWHKKNSVNDQVTDILLRISVDSVTGNYIIIIEIKII